MKSKIMTTAFAVAALSLPACSADDSADSASQVSTVEPTAAQTVTQDAPESWDDEKVQQWLDAEGGNDFSEFTHPFTLIESWEQGSEGEIIFTVDPAITDSDDVYLNDLGPANDLWLIPAVMMEQIHDEAPDLQRVTAETSDSQRSESYTRDQMEQTIEKEKALGTHQY